MFVESSSEDDVEADEKFLVGIEGREAVEKMKRDGTFPPPKRIRKPTKKPRRGASSEYVRTVLTAQRKKKSKERSFMHRFMQKEYETQLDAVVPRFVGHFYTNPSQAGRRALAEIMRDALTYVIFLQYRMNEMGACLKILDPDNKSKIVPFPTMMDIDTLEYHMKKNSMGRPEIDLAPRAPVERETKNVSKRVQPPPVPETADAYTSSEDDGLLDDFFPPEETRDDEYDDEPTNILPRVLRFGQVPPISTGSAGRRGFLDDE